MKTTTLFRPAHSKILFALFASLYLLIGGVTANAATTLASFEAKSMAYTSHGTVDTTTSNSVSLYWNAFGSKTIKIPSTTNRIGITARANVCDGGPEMVVYVGGKKIMSQEITSSDYKKYEVELTVPANTTQQLIVNFLNDYATTKNGIRCDRNLYLDKIDLINSNTAVTTPVPTPVPPTTAPTPTAPTVVSGGLYNTPYKTASTYAYSGEQRFVDWRKNNTAKVAAVKKIADQPQALWLGYSQDSFIVTRAVNEANAKKQIPVFVLYNIPNRDNGQYAGVGGGAKDTAAYKTWVDSIASKIGNSPTIIILEPDALGHGITGVYRKESLQYATQKLSTLKNSKVYLDATNSGWYGTSDSNISKIATRMKEVGIDRITGFATNVSNFRTTDQEIAFGNKVSALVGDKPFVIDTSRNGNGPRPAPVTAAEKTEYANQKASGEYYWCNPPNRALGIRPTTQTGQSKVNAYLWIKGPGDIDGPCRGAVKDLGNFWIDYAVGLSQRAKW